MNENLNFLPTVCFLSYYIGDAPSERGSLLRQEVFKRLRISRVESYKRVNKTIVSECYPKRFTKVFPFTTTRIRVEKGCNIFILSI